MLDIDISKLENDLDEFYKSKRSFAGLKRIMDESGAYYICSGTGRLVYQVSDEKVLKVAKNKAGLAQNGAEADWALRNYGVAAKWYDISDDEIWIESEFCKKARVSDFREKLGYSFDFFTDCIRYYDMNKNPQKYRYVRYPKPAGYEDTWNNEDLLSSMYNYIGDFDVPIGDLVRISSYGRNLEGDLVLTDTGLTNSIFEEFYKK